MDEKDKQAELGAIIYHTFEDGKYAVSFAGGKLYAFRNGLLWQDLTGDKLIYSMLAEVDLLKTKLAKSDFHPAPAVAQGEPVHFRAVLCGEQQDKALGVVPKVAGFVDIKAAEQFILEQRDFKGWRYNLEPLYKKAPAVAVNEQLLEALNLMLASVPPYRDDGTSTIPEKTIAVVNSAIAAAQKELGK